MPPKYLDKMNEEELGKLFPVFLCDHNPHWASLFQQTKQKLVVLLGDVLAPPQHIGSTAIPGIKAKPTIDILLQLKDDCDIDGLKSKLQANHWHFIPRPDKASPNMMFVRGYTSSGFQGQAYHLHIRYQGPQPEISFRDYLIAHPETASEYEKLKIQLARRFPNHRESYTNAKTEFIERIMKELKKPLD